MPHQQNTTKFVISSNSMNRIVVFAFVFYLLSPTACKDVKNVKPKNDKTTRSANFMTQSNDESRAPILIPGQSIGMIRIGMTRLEFKLQGIDLKSHPSGQFENAVSVVGPYQIVFEKDRVVSVTLKLKESLRGIAFAEKRLPATASLEEVAKALPDCGHVEEHEGGSVVSCGGGTTLVKRGAEDWAVEIQVVAPGYFHSNE